MLEFKAVYTRIMFATSTRTQSEVADVLEIRQSSISDAKRRNAIPADWFMKLFEKYGLNPDWLKQGEGPMFLRIEQGYKPPVPPVDGVAEESTPYGDAVAHVLVTVHSMACACTNNSALPTLRDVGKISMPLLFMSNSITVLLMDASNMEPGIMRGAYVGVDTANSHPVSGHVYALYSPYEGVIIRRIFYDGSTGCYLLRSDVEKYPEDCVNPTVLKAQMMGRVHWVLQRL